MARWLLAALFLVLPAWAEVSFQRDIRPILEQRCQMCHPAEGGPSGVALNSHEALLKTGGKGPIVIAGSPDRSVLFQQIRGDKPAMPKAGGPLSGEQVEMFREWIAAGAFDDSPDGAGNIDSTWWSFRELVRPPAPAVEAGWARTTVDRFILAKLQEQKLTPSPEADRRTLIRRLTYDLHGLPPTPEEIDAFESDPSPRAYESLVDRLLDSPRYGERWGRHWLDVIHYGESHGYDKDKPRRNAWPYRDYVIESFDQDKPYALFVEEQLAGDVLYPDDPKGLISTGFIAAGPWDYVGHAELREGTTDKNIARLLDRDDMLMQTMSTFASLTVHCARCHDHRFDPIQQADYYALQAVFAGVDRADRPYDLDPAVHKKRQSLFEQRRIAETALQPIQEKASEISSPELELISLKISELEEVSRDLLPKVGEEFTEDRVQRQKELGAELARVRQEQQKLRRETMNPELRERLEAQELRLKEIDAEIEALPEPNYVYTAASYFKQYGKFTPAWEPRPVHVLARGSVDSPLEAARAGAVTAVKALPARFEVEDEGDESARRLALAKWIVDPKNPFTWRSIVNRVWHYHFGKGIADSPNDFGRMGSAPTHPELLDWLAVEFRDAGGSIKDLHRLILTSAVYRQVSTGNREYEALDGSNRYLWRMNRLRLDAESVRDATLAVSGKIDLKRGGPSAEQFWFKDDHSPIYDYARFDIEKPEARRRSVYRFLVRSVPDPFMETLDCADPSLLVPARNNTLTPLQALAMLNDPLMVKGAEWFAERLRAESSDPAEQINFAYQLALGRAAGLEEIKDLSAYAAEHGLANAARLILNSNEFLFVD